MEKTDTEKAEFTEPFGEPITMTVLEAQEEAIRKKKREHVEHFFSTTTFHGLTHIVNPDELLHLRISWAIVVVCFLVISMQSIYSSVTNLMSYKLSSEISDVFTDNMAWGMTLPDIHICDSSIFNASRLRAMGFNDTMGTYLTLATSDNAPSASLFEDSDKQQALKEEFDRILANGSWTMKDVVDETAINCTDMILGCSTNGVWIPPDYCCSGFFKTKPFVTIFGSCVSASGLLQTYESRDAGFIVYATPNTRDIINFDASLIKPEYTLQQGLYYTVSSKTNNVEFVLHKDGRYALPNSWISIPISKTVVDNSELEDNILAPYTCVNANDPVHRELKAPNFKYYSESNCLSSIYQKNFQHFFNCSAVFSNYGNASEICDPSKIIGVDLGLILTDSPENRPNTICPSECVEEKYNMAPSYADLNPTNLMKTLEMYNMSKAKDGSDPVVLHFFYSSFIYQTRTNHPNTLANFLGEVGGNLGLFLGASLITIVEILALCIRCCTK